MWWQARDAESMAAYGVPAASAPATAAAAPVTAALAPVTAAAAPVTAASAPVSPLAAPEAVAAAAPFDSSASFHTIFSSTSSAAEAPASAAQAPASAAEAPASAGSWAQAVTRPTTSSPAVMQTQLPSYWNLERPATSIRLSGIRVQLPMSSHQEVQSSAAFDSTPFSESAT